jgi:hypothetical protein
MNHVTIRYGTDQLLVFGGSAVGGVAIATVQAMQSYASKTWANVGPLSVGRVGHVCTTLASGNILVFGGTSANASGAGISQTEVYDPTALTSSLVGSMGWGRGFGAPVTLASGKVAYIGGLANAQASHGAELFDPVAKTWSWLAGTQGGHVGQKGFLNGDSTITVSGATSDDLLTPAITSEVLSVTAGGPSKGNVGTFRVVAQSPNSVWVENSNAVIEEAQGNLVFQSYRSVMPGDIVRIGTRSFGLANQGDFTVGSVDLNQPNVFSVSGMTDFAPVALGASAALLQIIPAKATRLILKVARLVPDPSDPTLVSLFLVPGSLVYDQTDLPIDRINEAGGCVVSALDKLDFPIDVIPGSDAYRYNTGLLGEANRVLYGVLRDRETYPGYIAAGQVVNMAAALVRRIQVRLAVRVRPGADVKSRIQNAVAKVINTAGPNPIPLIDIADAAKVDGVISVVLLSPTYDAGHDTIPVQPYETPRVLNLDADIQVTFIGQ